ncbi:Spo0E family sporulation regulatory protein-aspartic acid phosphatase [Laceyella putida]|uniref:Spo0E family sporulation regulatory protein-aspartic acid phosphatase n=1 Tax=Laceyella putida TaxID=110101 RepID=A0ABW2RFJ6_9BACL
MEICGTLAERMECVRRRMEKAALDLGLGHPQVYQLSQEMDRLHNMWEQACSGRKRENVYHIRSNMVPTKEANEHKRYKVM